MTSRMLACVTALLVTAAMLGDSASAQNYPTKPVRIVVPVQAGGPTDIVARLIAQKLSERLGQQFYVENRPGGSGNIGAGVLARAAPDGYTIGVVSSGYLINPAISEKLPYDPENDFAPVTLIGVTPIAFLVNPSIPVNSVSDLVALLKRDTRQYSFASPGLASPARLSAERFRYTHGLDMVHVPFNGAEPAIQSVIAGHTPIGFGAVPPAAPQVKAGRLRALAIMSPNRSSALPDIPTMVEAGFRGYDAETIQGLLAPANTPKEIITMLHREIARLTALPDIQQKFEALGIDAVGSTPDEFAARIKEELARWRNIVRETNLKIE